jgi:galactose-1-phosphate uridylyltransferase
MLAEVLRESTRIVERHADYPMLVPYAAASPCELWIVPRRHAAGFTRAPEDMGALAHVLRSALRRLATHLDDPPYNYVFESFDAEADAPWLHWRLRIVPRLGRPRASRSARGCRSILRVRRTTSPRCGRRDGRIRMLLRKLKVT